MSAAPAAPIATLLPPGIDTDYLDAVFLDGGDRLRSVEHKVLSAIPPDALRLWCHRRGVYGIATPELLDVVRHIIDGRPAIEIGAGMGVFGRELGIPMTDSYNMERPEVRAMYEQLKQPVTRYGADVERLDALEATQKYRPQVVFGSWITQRVRPEEFELGKPGSITGVDELRMLESIETYVMFGNHAVHAHKDILRASHLDVKCLFSPSFWSRSATPQLNCLYVVNRKT